MAYPHHKQYEMDLHRPYIDAITLTGRAGARLRTHSGGHRLLGRVRRDAVCISNHYPFRDTRASSTPAASSASWPKAIRRKFIAEYIGQTRTWFYYMLAVSTVLFGPRLVSQNVVVDTATPWRPMAWLSSKSKGNYTDPLNYR